jgi:hypothetical protein
VNDLEFCINSSNLTCAVGADFVYPVGNLHIASTFDQDSQSLAGGVFNVATRVSTFINSSGPYIINSLPQIGTSIGLAVSSSIATAISKKYGLAHPSLTANSPEVLMVGFRAAGWTGFAAAVLAFIIGLVGLRGIGIVGQQKKAPISAEIVIQTDPPDIILSAMGHDTKSLAGPAQIESQHT